MLANNIVSRARLVAISAGGTTAASAYESAFAAAVACSAAVLACAEAADSHAT
ncbi:hypothetical protein MAHJHV63_50740 [Mycobacterium avium subsp. hominissuis]